MRFFRRRQADVEAELQAHLEIEADQLVREGHTPADARALARRAMGGAARPGEAYYDANPLSWLADAGTDVRYALRKLRTQPGFSGSVIAVSALGLTACITTFSLVSGILLAPLPFPAPDRVFELLLRAPDVETASIPVTLYHELSQRSPAVDAIGAGTPTRVTVRRDGELLRLPAVAVTPSYFRVYRLRPTLGRFFDDRDVADRANVALLGYEEWRAQFGSDSSVVGRTLRINEQPWTIVGVMPPRFLDRSQSQRAVWIPMDVDDPRQRGSVNAVLRIADSLTVDRARVLLGGMGAQVAPFGSPDSTRARAAIVPMADIVLGAVQRPLFVLFGSVGLVLLLVAANIATMFLAQVSARGGELTVRLALGSGRGRQVRQLMTESLALTGVGGLLGVGASVVLVALVRSLGTGVLPRMEDVAVDWRVALFALGAILVVGWAGGIAQSLGTWRGSLVSFGTSARVTSPRTPASLVVVQVSLSVLLLIGAGLLVKEFLRVSLDAPGFEIRNRAALLVDLDARDASGSADAAVALERIERIRSQLATVPGVASVAVTTYMPLSGLVAITQVHPDTSDARTPAYSYAVGANYFETMGMRILRGRNVTAEDRAGSAAVTVISETAARAWFGTEDPVGRVIRVGRGTAVRPVTVVGVVNDIRLSGRSARMRPHVYLPVTQEQLSMATFAVATRGDVHRVLPTLRSAIARTDPAVAIESATDMESMASGAVSRSRFFSVAMSLFAIAAIGLSALGIHGLLAFTVSQHRMAIGIRKALGATEARIGRAVVGRAALLGVSGVILGTAAALVLSRFLDGLLVDIPARDPMVFATAALVGVGVSLAAGVLPAVAAIRVDPALTMRA